MHSLFDACLMNQGRSNNPTLTALLHFEGANGSTTYTDEKGHTFTTIAADTAISTTKSKFGSASFNRTSNPTSGGIYSNSADFAPGTGDFTVGGWVWCPTGTRGTLVVLKSDALAGGSGGDLTLMWEDHATTYCRINSVDLVLNGLGWDSNWHHIEMTRSGTDVRLFKDGVQVGATASSSFDINDTYLQIGGGLSGYQLRTGSYIDEFYFIKGLAWHTANFTPPAAPLT